MNRIRPALLLSLLIAAGTGCSAPATPEEVASLEQAVNACNETVPTNRFVDGLPAYAQCSGVSSGNIWSNNGIDTATASGGTDWIQTQRGGGYQCTEWAYRYMRFRWNVSYRSGNAKEWCNGTLPSNLVKTTVPVHGDLIVFDGGVCGSDATTGHVAVVDVVNASAQSVTIVEENDAGRRSAKQTCALCYLHAVANDGTTAGAGGVPGSGSGGGASAGSGNGGMSSGNGGTASGTSGGRSSARGGATNGGSNNTGGAVTANGGASGGATNGGTNNANGGTNNVNGGAGNNATGGTTSTNAGATNANGGAIGAGGASGGAAQGGSAPTGNGGSTAPAAGAEGNPVRPGALEASCSCAVPGAENKRGSSSGVALGSLLLPLALVLRRRRRMRAGGTSKADYSGEAESPPR